MILLVLCSVKWLHTSVCSFISWKGYLHWWVFYLWLSLWVFDSLCVFVVLKFIVYFFFHCCGYKRWQGFLTLCLLWWIIFSLTVNQQRNILLFWMYLCKLKPWIRAHTRMCIIASLSVYVSLVVSHTVQQWSAACLVVGWSGTDALLLLRIAF